MWMAGEERSRGDEVEEERWRRHTDTTIHLETVTRQKIYKGNQRNACAVMGVGVVVVLM